MTTSHTLDRTIGHPLARIFAALSTLDDYPKILKVVRSAEILDRMPSTLADTETVRFAMRVGYGLIATRFVGRALVNTADHVIVVAQESGPFESMRSRLRLTAMGSTRTRLQMTSEWTFPTTGIGGLIGGLMQNKGATVQRKVVAAFVNHLDANPA